MKTPFHALYVPTPRPGDKRGFQAYRVKVLDVYETTKNARIELPGAGITFAPISTLATKPERAAALVNERIAALLAVEEPPKPALAGTASGAQT